MRGPEGHEGDPPADPPADPSSLVDGGDPPADPSTGEFVAPVDQAALDKLIQDAVEAAKPAASEPIKAEDFKVPEGFELNEDLSGELLEILNGEQSPQDRANALLALHAKTLTTALEADSKAWADMQTEWRTNAKNDPEVGGEKLKPALDNIGKLLDEYGSKELRDVFNMTGAGNHPLMIKFLNKVAGELTEGKLLQGKPGGYDPNAAASRLFPTANKG